MRPNILLITCHDLGRHLGCYGRGSVSSPAIDRLAADGVLFEQNYCTAPQCSPSRAALHTARHAHTVGMLGLAHSPFSWRLHSGERHTAQILRESGYETVLWGVQHLTRTPEAAALGYQRHSLNDPVVPAPQLATRVEAFLREPERHERPFYAEVGFFEPHRPYDWGGAQSNNLMGVEIPSWLSASLAAREEFAALQGAIRQLDAGVGRILNALEESGLADNTWVIFVTDHGLAMPRAKCTLYDPGIEAALIMRWPGGDLAGGQRIEYLTSHVDVLPTLLDGLELPAPANLHGQSTWPLLRGRPYTPRKHIFAEKTFHTAYEPMRGIRTAMHKLIVNFEVDTAVNVPDDIRMGGIYRTVVSELAGQRDVIELYDLRSDPLEQHNLADVPEAAAIEERLLTELLNWMRRTNDPLLGGPVASPYYRRALNRLGASQSPPQEKAP